MAPSAPGVTEFVHREELVARRARLAGVVAEVGSAPDLLHLIGEVDAAIRRYDEGGYGQCEICHESMSDRTLRVSPLNRYCLCELTDAELSVLDRDLELAWQIQSGLLPHPGLEIGAWSTHFRYLPAGRVGGDYLDLVVTRPGEEFFFLIGDVSGKGVAASVLMAHLHAVLRSLIVPGADPAAVVAAANAVFAESTLAGQYATLLCGRADSGGGVYLCNAGHMPPYVVGAARMEPLLGGGVPVGLFPAARYESRRVRLEAGESFFLYTDGLSESVDGEGNELGLSGIEAALRPVACCSPAALAAAALGALESDGDATRHDDLSVMVVRRG